MKRPCLRFPTVASGHAPWKWRGDRATGATIRQMEAGAMKRPPVFIFLGVVRGGIEPPT
jgi:hypothetical protein